MKKTILRNYAKLIAQKGINVQKGQEVCITAELDQPEFVKILVEECYRAGAGKVIVDWCYQPLTKLNVRW
ncbi:MAG: aminopeptidase, partial [Ruminococcus sp.]